jgi:N-acetylglutamate synthase
MAHGHSEAEQPPIGQRVVVRSLVPGERGPSGGPAMTDVVGVLEVADEREVVVRRRDGTVQRVARADIVVMKSVPPPPSPRPPSTTG